MPPFGGISQLLYAFLTHYIDTTIYWIMQVPSEKKTNFPFIRAAWMCLPYVPNRRKEGVNARMRIY